MVCSTRAKAKLQKEDSLVWKTRCWQNNWFQKLLQDTNKRYPKIRTFMQKEGKGKDKYRNRKKKKRFKEHAIGFIFHMVIKNVYLCNKTLSQGQILGQTFV
jgi:hypothetical protein